VAGWAAVVRPGMGSPVPINKTWANYKIHGA